MDFVSKPKIDVAHTLQGYGEEIRAKVKAAAGARVRALTAEQSRPGAVPPRYSADAVLAPDSYNFV